MSISLDSVKNKLIRKPPKTQDYVLRVNFKSDQYSAEVFTELVKLAARVDTNIQFVGVHLREFD